MPKQELDIREKVRVVSFNHAHIKIDSDRYPIVKRELGRGNYDLALKIAQGVKPPSVSAEIEEEAILSETFGSATADVSLSSQVRNHNGTPVNVHRTEITAQSKGNGRANVKRVEGEQATSKLALTYAKKKADGTPPNRNWAFQAIKGLIRGNVVKSPSEQRTSEICSDIDNQRVKGKQSVVSAVRSNLAAQINPPDVNWISRRLPGRKIVYKTQDGQDSPPQEFYLPERSAQELHEQEYNGPTDLGARETRNYGFGGIESNHIVDQSYTNPAKKEIVNASKETGIPVSVIEYQGGITYEINGKHVSKDTFFEKTGR